MEQGYGPPGLQISRFHDKENSKAAVKKFFFNNSLSAALKATCFWVSWDITFSYSGSSVVAANHREGLTNPWLPQSGSNGWTRSGHGHPESFFWSGTQPGLEAGCRGEGTWAGGVHGLGQKHLQGGRPRPARWPGPRPLGPGVLVILAPLLTGCSPA